MDFLPSLCAFPPYILLTHQPEPDHSNVMIERIGKPNSLAFHDWKAGD